MHGYFEKGCILFQLVLQLCSVWSGRSLMPRSWELSLSCLQDLCVRLSPDPSLMTKGTCETCFHLVSLFKLPHRELKKKNNNFWSSSQLFSLSCMGKQFLSKGWTWYWKWFGELTWKKCVCVYKFQCAAHWLLWLSVPLREKGSQAPYCGFCHRLTFFLCHNLGRDEGSQAVTSIFFPWLAPVAGATYLGTEFAYIRPTRRDKNLFLKWTNFILNLVTLYPHGLS